ncbi:hypothetical protein [Nonomuraea rubra]|uniref:Transposase n=1 Tax=Nonomuraea rubra TaxID=46180 RepID=A0A7X0NWS8_9ACTN|nr:hypothetical protein [Nonomuraea rubra]MBB6550879.1 hypothetical protein [Nonomuraea rubra]
MEMVAKFPAAAQMLTSLSAPLGLQEARGPGDRMTLMAMTKPLITADEAPKPPAAEPTGDEHPPSWRSRWSAGGHRPRRGRKPQLTDAELLTLAVAQVLLGIHSETRWLRYVPEHLPGAFAYLPGQSGYNKRLDKTLPLFKRVIWALAQDTDLWTGPVWSADSTPVECGRSRPHQPALEPGRLGRLRLLPLPLMLVLGPAPASDLHPRPTCRSPGPGDPEHRRTPSPDGPVRERPAPARRPARALPRHRLVRAGHHLDGLGGFHAAP